MTELLLHMAAPRTCLGAGDHLGLDPHLQQSRNVRLAAVGAFYFLFFIFIPSFIFIFISFIFIFDCGW